METALFNHKPDRSAPAVRFEDVWAAYDREPVLQGVSIDVQQGEMAVVIGPNGAGKSTLFKLLVGVKKPLKGDLRVFGSPIDVQRRQSAISYLPQAEQIDWDYPISVWGVVMGGRYGRMRMEGGARRFFPPSLAAQEHKEAVRSALRAVDMEAYARRPIGALSGGQRRRVFLARLLAQDARLLLLDEPLNGVDRKSEALIVEVLERLKEQGKTLMIITHDLAGVRDHADRIILLNRRLVADGPPEEVLTEERLNEAFGGEALARLRPVAAGLARS